MIAFSLGAHLKRVYGCTTSVTGAECCVAPEKAVIVTVYEPGGVPRFWKFRADAHPFKTKPHETSIRVTSSHPAFPRLHLRLRNPKPEIRRPEIGNRNVNKGPWLTEEFSARNGSPAVVTTKSVAVAGFAPGVTLAGFGKNVVLAGRPVAAKLMGLVKALFCGVTVTT